MDAAQSLPRLSHPLPSRVHDTGWAFLGIRADLSREPFRQVALNAAPLPREAYRYP